MRKNFFSKGEMIFGDLKTTIFNFCPSFPFFDDRIFYEGILDFVKPFEREVRTFFRKYESYEKRSFFKYFFINYCIFIIIMLYSMV